ncbi:uncharacterized protein BXIN_0274 [Babesia sp. Xinjiang]|uniref:uncharacterized protein n=1 Tax=Babesia sp. Xinjiang TaxID=462227 RepID=UPI000A259E40|nr:uncharacterized protein BXIN_0274 [Babesia sp. Xinjiang]ORM39681.1 hypothetical protein BXIN_0274 [Babesia sp. Xinjiang]
MSTTFLSLLTLLSLAVKGDGVETIGEAHHRMPGAFREQTSFEKLKGSQKICVILGILIITAIVCAIIVGIVKKDSNTLYFIIPAGILLLVGSFCASHYLGPTEVGFTKEETILGAIGLSVLFSICGLTIFGVTKCEEAYFPAMGAFASISLVALVIYSAYINKNGTFYEMSGFKLFRILIAFLAFANVIVGNPLGDGVAVDDEQVDLQAANQRFHGLLDLIPEELAKEVTKYGEYENVPKSITKKVDDYFRKVRFAELVSRLPEELAEEVGQYPSRSKVPSELKQKIAAYREQKYIKDVAESLPEDLARELGKYSSFDEIPAEVNKRIRAHFGRSTEKATSASTDESKQEKPVDDGSAPRVKTVSDISEEPVKKPGWFENLIWGMSNLKCHPDYYVETMSGYYEDEYDNHYYDEEPISTFAARVLGSTKKHTDPQEESAPAPGQVTDESEITVPQTPEVAQEAATESVAPIVSFETADDLVFNERAGDRIKQFIAMLPSNMADRFDPYAKRMLPARLAEELAALEDNKLTREQAEGVARHLLKEYIRIIINDPAWMPITPELRQYLGMYFFTLLLWNSDPQYLAPKPKLDLENFNELYDPEVMLASAGCKKRESHLDTAHAKEEPTYVASSEEVEPVVEERSRKKRLNVLLKKLPTYLANEASKYRDVASMPPYIKKRINEIVAARRSDDLLSVLPESFAREIMMYSSVCELPSTVLHDIFNYIYGKVEAEVDAHPHVGKDRRLILISQLPDELASQISADDEEAFPEPLARDIARYLAKETVEICHRAWNANLLTRYLAPSYVKHILFFSDVLRVAHALNIY